MTDFQDLYQEIILDHYKNPRNDAAPDEPSLSKVYENPNCGDKLKVSLKIDGSSKVVEEIKIDVSGCAISVASASMMTEFLTGKTIDSVRDHIQSFLDIMRGKSNGFTIESWGEVAALSGVIQFPLRVKCATLAWHAVHEELANN